jgi:hypothetical protein
LVVAPGRLSKELLANATACGVAGIIASSMLMEELEEVLQVDMTALLDGVAAPESSHPTPVLLFTEGLGSRPMASPTLALLRQHGGDWALLSGATNPRRTQRPELLISLPLGTRVPAVKADPRIVNGALVRVSSGDYAGQIGQVVHIFQRPQRLPSGIHTPAVYVRLEKGQGLTLPIYNVERIA